MTVDHLPPYTPIVPLYYISRDIEQSFLGPQLLATEFRRLNSSKIGRLIFLDMFGPDKPDRASSLVAIPSGDVSLTESQRGPLLRNLDLDRDVQFPERTPFLSHVLNTGLFCSDYNIDGEGALAARAGCWSAVWGFLDTFTRSEAFEHPRHHTRLPASYRHPLCLLNDRLYREDHRELDRSTSLKRDITVAELQSD